jgi:putative transposase
MIKPDLSPTGDKQLNPFIKGYKYRFYPNKSQIELLNNTFGCCRFVYNRLLDQSIKEYEAYKADNSLPNTQSTNAVSKPKVSGYDLIKQLPILKQEYQFLNNVSSVALQQSAINLGKSYSNFFNKKGMKQHGYPKFKSKHGYQSFTLTDNAFKFRDNKLTIAKSDIPLNIRWSRELPSTPTSATISKTPSGKYFISFVCEYTPTKTNGTSITGIDLGIKDLIVTSDGLKIPNPKHLAKLEKRLARYQRRLSRCKKGSKNRNKARLKVARLHERITNQRNDFHHKLSRKLINENQVIGIESLMVKNMVKNRCLSKAISQAAWSSFTGQLFYKSKESQHCNIVKIDTFFPSTHICNVCDTKLDRKLSLAERTFQCPLCHVLHDRDINAAINIRNEAIRIINETKTPNIGVLVLANSS